MVLLKQERTTIQYNTIQYNTIQYNTIQTEYYVSVLIRRFVSLRVACVKSYHARPIVNLNVLPIQY